MLARAVGLSWTDPFCLLNVMTERPRDKTSPVADGHLAICESCGATVPGYDTVNYGSIEQGSRRLCNPCLNATVAEEMGLEDFDNCRIESMRLTGGDGREHHFHFTTRLLGDRLAIEAFEIQYGAPGGYKFQILGSPDEERFELLSRLLGKMRRALAQTHLVEHEHFGLHIADQRVRGRIAADLLCDQRCPMLIIDGKEVTWEDFGRMLMSFEGWQFRMDLIDRSEEA